mgnify:CR=1 FL=1
MKKYYKILEYTEVERTKVPDGYYYKTIYKVRLTPTNWPLSDEHDTKEEAEDALATHGKEGNHYIIQEIYRFPGSREK